MIPIGYMYKKVIIKPDWLKAADIAAVYSVSNWSTDMKTPLPLTLLLLALITGNTLAADNPMLEPLYSAEFDDTYVTIEVKSTGCTRPEDFTILASGKGGEDFSTLGILRDRPDLCRTAPHLIRLHLELPGALAALKEPYKLENLFVSKTGFTQTP